MSSHVLLLTAEPKTARRLTALLADRGMTVATDGPEGSLDREPPPDLVVVDTQLGEDDAPSVVARIVRDPLHPPVLVLADRAHAESAVAAMRVGADDVVFQPLDPLGLPARVEGLLARRRVALAAEQVQTLEFRNQELESFIYIVTHDMKTPVVNLQGLVGLIEQDHGEQLPEPAREYLGRLRRNAERLEDLLRDLLEYPRKLRIVGPLEPHESGRVAAAAVDGLAELARSAGVDVSLADDMPTVDCDAKRLQQVFHNLVENAIKHSEGRPAPRVDVGWTRTPRGPLFHVRDTGPGIPREHLKDVFRLFHRIPGTTVDGTGIGLAVARQLVEAHGGEIWCESRVDEGTTFLFTLGG